ncbi:CmpA/NrtA family ABC transporter substrate-binding protein [Uliginosibacterium sp. sgz301328]|uniref:CmpA/NrtA family ABC transporter substrate-binding protein n=1 Tax=Uliginosibacterium sp. sgz301328 TaxID=3243764 RepID=UPI00359EEBC1
MSTSSPLNVLPPTEGESPEKTHVRIGFVPLTDCAPLVAARALGLGERFGLEIELVRQPSWAAIRDKLLSGELDAAHALYGLVYGVQLGIGGPQADMAVLMTLNQNGQAITLSRPFAEAVAHGTTLRDALAALGRRPVFAQTFPTGTHAMWLYYWLASQGIHPMHDVNCVVIPPPQMSAALAQGLLDGFCAGEPWNAVAEAEEVGRTVAASSEIWPDHPEKVLACRRDFAALYPATARRLTMAMLEACRWLDVAENRERAAAWLATPEVIGRPARLIAPRMLHAYGNDGDRGARPLRFFDGGKVNFPYLSDGAWFVSQYLRWGLIDSSQATDDIAASVNQTALYQQAARALGIDVPVSANRDSVLIDGHRWRGSRLQAFAEEAAVKA